MKASAYIRVSSKAQDFDTQRAAIERAATARGDTIGRWYSEKRSGKTIDRPVLSELRADARAGQIRRLFVFRLDRLTRSGIRDTLDVVEEFKKCGVELVTLADGFSLDGPAAEIILAVMSWSARMERLAISERISAARERLEAEGRPWGRPRRWDAETLARARRMRSGGRSVREIAQALKCPRSTVARALSQKPALDSDPAEPVIGAIEPPT